MEEFKMKKIKYKTQVFAICFILSLNLAFAQKDSLKNPGTLKTSNLINVDEVLYVKDGSFGYMEAGIADSIKGKRVNQIIEAKFENIFRITFKKNNYLDLLNSSGESKTVNLKYATEFKIYKGTYTLTGALIGIAGGALIGLLIGNSWDNNHGGGYSFGKAYGVAIGAPIGLVIGIITGSLIKNNETLNLESINEKNRQDELRYFLKNSE
jgi:hypothetical protein